MKVLIAVVIEAKTLKDAKAFVTEVDSLVDEVWGENHKIIHKTVELLP